MEIHNSFWNCIVEVATDLSEPHTNDIKSSIDNEIDIYLKTVRLNWAAEVVVSKRNNVSNPDIF